MTNDVRIKLYEMQDKGISIEDMVRETGLLANTIKQVLENRKKNEDKCAPVECCGLQTEPPDVVITISGGAPQELVDAVVRVANLINMIRPEDSVGTLMGFREVGSEILISAFKPLLERGIDHFGDWGVASRG